MTVIVVKCSKCGEVQTLDSKDISGVTVLNVTDTFQFRLKHNVYIEDWKLTVEYMVCQECVRHDDTTSRDIYNASFKVREEDKPLLVAVMV